MIKTTLRKNVLVFIFLYQYISSVAQPYKPDWESLDTRPVPQWYTNAKFGIFIHWGVYAVPGYCPVGNYAEWYQYALSKGQAEYVTYHKKKFGERTYYDLANDFRAELFNADEWADVFEKSGAKYMVLTSKHHDGFCLWPNEKANQTWGFKWNAKDIGPQRDLLGELFTAVRKTSVHAGMYYSLYEWFNPLWKKDKVQYANEHAWPQMTELINIYKPDVFWTDGDWDASDKTWRSTEFLAWLYNESAVKDKVVTMDRWGSGVRFKHGGVFTPEYQPDLDFENHAWEESRGMGFSYGYNRNEDAWHYNSTQSLVLQLIDKVSRGGNFLLDIGPDEHGKIPPIMQERLLQMGDWLKINGEAIYNTVRWKNPEQWSGGRRDYKNKSGDMLLKITINPDSGYAVKEIFYTYNATSNTLYALFPKYPSDRKLILKNVVLPQQSVITFLSTGEKLNHKQTGSNTEIELPLYDPNKIKAPYAYAIKISGYGKFAAKPKINVSYKNGSLSPTITLNTTENVTIRYTTDGNEPTASSAAYTKPFTLNHTAIVKAAAFYNGALPSGTVSQQVQKFEWQAAANVSALKQGIAYKYFEPEGKINMSSINSSAIIKIGTATEISVKVKQREEKFSIAFNGYIKIDDDALYNFYTASDDGSKLFINDIEVVNNDGDHGTEEKSGLIALKKGMHKITVHYFDSGGGNELNVLWNKYGEKKIPLAAGVLFN